MFLAVILIHIRQQNNQSEWGIAVKQQLVQLQMATDTKYTHALAPLSKSFCSEA